MSIDTLYNLNIDSPTQITNEQYDDVGADWWQVGTVKRAFYDVEIWDDTDSNAVQLAEDVDYELGQVDSYYTSEAGFDIYTAIKILNAAYQAGSIYVTYKTIGSYTDGTIFNDYITRLNNANPAILAVTADYAITDVFTYNTFLVDPSDGDITVTLPTVADNSDRVITVKVSVLGGKVTVDGEGGEEIEGAGSIYLQNLGDILTVISDGTQWNILKLRQSYDTGWINRSDWTNVHMGSVVLDYDNLAGAFTVGETITGAGGDTGIVQSDTGSTLVLKNVTGTGVFVNDEVITGATSLATADVNEPAGTAKNQDQNVCHELGLNLNQIRVEVYFSTDGTENNSRSFIYYSYYTASAVGIVPYQTDINNIKLQTGDAGVATLDDNGNTVAIDTEDYYYRTKIERII